MYLIAHVMTVELDIVSVVGVASNVNIKATSYKDDLFKSLKQGVFDCIRTIFQRNTRFKGVEYHCIDFKGRSFILIDPTGAKKSAKEVIDWVNEQDIKHSLSAKENKSVYISGPEHFITRKPRMSEDYFHQFAIMESKNFFYSHDTTPNTTLVRNQYL